MADVSPSKLPPTSPGGTPSSLDKYSRDDLAKFVQKLTAKDKQVTARLQQITAAYKQMLVDKKAMWAVLQAVAGIENPEPKKLAEFKLAEHIKTKCKAVATATAKGWKEKYDLAVETNAGGVMKQSSGEVTSTELEERVQELNTSNEENQIKIKKWQAKAKQLQQVGKDAQAKVKEHQITINQLQAKLDQANSLSDGASQPQEAPSADAPPEETGGTIEKAAASVDGSNGEKFKSTLLEIQAELASMQRLGKDLAAGGAALAAEKQKSQELEERVEELTKSNEEHEVKIKKWQAKAKQLQLVGKDAQTKLKEVEAAHADGAASAAAGGVAHDELQEELAELRQREGEKEAMLTRMRKE
jgi:hypothetical protein